MIDGLAMNGMQLRTCHIMGSCFDQAWRTEMKTLNTCKYKKLDEYRVWINIPLCRQSSSSLQTVLAAVSEILCGRTLTAEASLGY